MVDVINFDTSDMAELQLKLKQTMGEESELKSRIFVMTPSVALKLSTTLAKEQILHTAVLDKVDLLQALDFGDDLKKLSYLSRPKFRCIFTSTDCRDNSVKDKNELEEYKQIKQNFMGEEKALIIKMNLNQEQTSKSIFEQLGHLYVLTETNLDKYILLFGFLKLAIVEGKTIIFTNDIIEAYRVKLFLNKFSLKVFVIAPDMPKN